MPRGSQGMAEGHAFCMLGTTLVSMDRKCLLTDSNKTAACVSKPTIPDSENSLPVQMPSSSYNTEIIVLIHRENRHWCTYRRSDVIRNGTLLQYIQRNSLQRNR